ncbi:MAG: hypothetical protein AB7E60_12700 [Sphingobium sp.]
MIAVPSPPVAIGPYPPTLMCATVSQLLGRFDDCGPLQITVRCDGVGHEQFGRLQLRAAGDRLLVEGDMTLTIETAMIDRIILNQQRGLTVADQHRIDFVTRDNVTAFSLLNLAEDSRWRTELNDMIGEPVHDAPLQLFPAGQDAALDPALPILDAACRAGSPVEVQLAKPGASATWRGQIHALSASRDYVNVIQPDFHLHLRGGRIPRWEEERDAGGAPFYRAIDPQGEGMDLSIRVMARAPDE